MFKNLLVVGLENRYLHMTFLFALSVPLSWKISRAILVLIMLVWILSFDYKKLFLKVKNSSFIILMMVFVLYQLCTMLWTSTPLSEEHTYFENYFLWFAIPILSYVLKKEQIPTIITGFLLGMAISEIIAYGMYFEFWTINGQGASYPSPFMHHTAYSVFMAFSAILLINRLYSSDYNYKEKIIMGIFFVTISGNLFISQGRIGQLAFAIAIFTAGIMHFHLRFKTLLFSFILVASIFTAAYYASPMFKERIQMGVNDVKNISAGNLNTSWGIRVAYIILGTEIIKDYPLFGVGIGDMQQIAKIYMDQNRTSLPDVFKASLPKSHFHNQYLMILIQSGVIGLILFLAIFYTLFKLPIENPEIKRASMLFVIILLIVFISDPFLLVNQVRALFLLFASLFCAASL